jgi:DNA-binding transcriptional MerR regulator
MGYSIKAMAEKANLSPHVLRYYEKEGLLPHVKRTKGGIRHYSDEDLEWLGLICCLKNTGMSIKQIRDFVNLSIQGPETLKARCEMLVAHKREVEERIEEMNRHLQKVSHKIEYFTRQYEEYTAEEEYRQAAVQTPQTI